ncbi:phosphate ABC transporter permease subunit PstC [Synechococcus sp. PCC 6312]|uniref:phosphate ABC transporter permease subunit PstC n=1 Tax=Synechococcus sp. (strain ATCC 27167 / PCC 6312) TaxID=195253 RepID=UPI00029F3E30|nr:phosphate ABC transporter permease subunit PstC [Synechococcus sp. PCC 6312]AFY62606.1 phosphate ABC transporter membrane protein 1, PhoT family [Synechococcus sp. PCC 6312]
MTTSLPQAPAIAQPRTPQEKLVDRGFIWLTRICAYGIAILLLFIGLRVAIEAGPAISKFGLGFLVTESWNPVTGIYGALPVIYGTFVTCAIALLLGVPIGVGTAIFLSENFIPVAVRTVLVFLIELLAAIPSVVYGLWGIFVLIPILRDFGGWLHNAAGWFPLFSTQPTGPGLLPAGVVLAIMILPIITAISRDSLASLPPELRQASIGLGATRWETVFRVLVPAAFSGIIGAIILALGRAMGETMAVTMLIGNSNQVNISLFAPGNTVASLLASQFAEASGIQVAALMYAGLVLFFMTFVVNVIAELIVLQVKKF